MPRPRRHPDAVAVPFTLYMTPAARDALRDGAKTAGKPPGAFVEALLASAVAAAPHQWVDHTALGKLCAVCGSLKARAGTSPCPGTSEAP